MSKRELEQKGLKVESTFHKTRLLKRLKIESKSEKLNYKEEKRTI